MTNPQPAWQDPSANPPPTPDAFPAPEPVSSAPAPTFGADPYTNPVQPVSVDPYADPARPVSAEPQPFGGEPPTAVVPQQVSANPYANPANPYANPADPYVVPAQPAPYGYPQPGPYGSPQPGPYGFGYPGYPMPAPTNGMAIGSMVVSISAILFLTCYGVGGLIGVVGAILGHVSRKQIRERGEGGDGMALAGIIVGWIATALGLLIVAFFVVLVVFAVNQPSTGY
ncbi:DUF4190 domain-containing protein [Micromonosporaceae bacterium DT194]|uniref:DUF4190 domain-containing protein n=1 Tax=Melissospora conviva TaxID=3388432 RepID=UPI003C29FDE9